MQNRTLSLIIGTALIMPTLAMAAPIDNSNVTPADMRTTPVENTLQTEIEGADGELLATQPGEVESDETVVETAPEEVTTITQSQQPNQQYSSSEIYPPVTEPADTDEYAAPAETDTSLTEDTFQGE